MPTKLENLVFLRSLEIQSAQATVRAGMPVAAGRAVDHRASGSTKAQRYRVRRNPNSRCTSQEGLRVGDGRLDLQTVAYNAGVLVSSAALFCDASKRATLLRVEVRERTLIARPLMQDRRPGQARPARLRGSASRRAGGHRAPGGPTPCRGSRCSRDRRVEPIGSAFSGFRTLCEDASMLAVHRASVSSTGVMGADGVFFHTARSARLSSARLKPDSFR